MKNRAWKKYAFEFISIFVAIIAAFALTKWNDDRKEALAESKILVEILNGIKKDKYDFQLNTFGHQEGIRAIQFWQDVFNGESPSTDSLINHYQAMTRDFISIQNNSGYETLKSRGFELIKNDSLRTKIISLYEYDYKTLKNLEEEYHELQFHENYFVVLNQAIAPQLKFDQFGNIVGLDLPLSIPESQRRLLQSYLWKIRSNRLFILNFYKAAEANLDQVIRMIEHELQ
jgi:hypothetical protein